MSRLTTSPFHKPSPFEFPTFPPSPPDTLMDTVGPTRMVKSGGHDFRPSDTESLPGIATNGPESAGVRFRRAPSIAYHSSSLKESPARIPQRTPKAFIIVIPPATFTEAHGQLGHTLSSGPRYRLSQGLLMPLFPTMYGQLTAIAREFNFPSTTGLCLYFHITENGITLTPRISDETWPFIWSHVFEVSAPVPAQRSPISGKIEFDIDISQARWYTSWVSSSQRDPIDFSFSAAPSVVPSTSHFRGESKSTIAEDNVDDNSPARPISGQNKIAAPIPRHIPRKLSLVDRYDMTSVRSGLRRSTHSPPELPPALQTLSPIVQEEEPKSARLDLDTRVKSWRASAVLKPTSLAATGQTSLEPANMPNTLPIDDTLISTPEQELNLADYTWSISSAGPNEYDPFSPLSWDRLPSVHIANRIQESVCMTPSDCTSFGPSDYTLPSPMASFYRLPSPDIAHRMYEDAPPTPSTATSWGAPLSYPPSPLSYYRAPSIDLGERLVFSRPCTPSTATSWGPGSWPPSPFTVDRPLSVHIGDRNGESRPVTPSTATSWGAPLSYPPSPTSPFRIETPDIGQRGFDDTEVISKRIPWAHSWPYIQRIIDSPHPAESSPKLNSNEDQSDLISVHVPSGYPYMNIYQSTYPYFDLYPAEAATMGDKLQYRNYSSISPTSPVIIRVCPNYPVFDLYPAIYPGNLNEIYPSIIGTELLPISTPCPTLRPWRNSGYPDFDLYPAVFNDRLESNSRLDSMVPLDKIVEPSVRLNTYPVFDLYPALYPAFSIYPIVESELIPRWEEGDTLEKPVELSIRLNLYPIFDLYPVIYPAFNIYPAVEYRHPVENKKELSVGLDTYPAFNLYPALYPAFDIYPIVEYGPMIVKHQGDYLPRKAVELSTKLDIYPVFNLYPALYPTFDIYPVVERGFMSCPNTQKILEVSVRFNGYPVFDLYPPIYPAFNLYPAIEHWHTSSRHCDTTLGYPKFDLYPAVQVILTPKIATPSTKTMELSVQLNAYPTFNLYPAVYPAFDIYPPIERGPATDQQGGKVLERQTRLSARHNVYPVFDLYPAADGESIYDTQVTASVKSMELLVRLNTYPIFDLYPALYPDFNLYPAVQPVMKRQDGNKRGYPYFDIYPHLLGDQSNSDSSVAKLLPVRVQPSYPAFDLYPPVYPFIEIYPPLSLSHLHAKSQIIKPEYPHSKPSLVAPISLSRDSGPIHYPNFNLYPPVYPYFDLYPSTSHEEDSGLTVIGSRYPAFNLYPPVYPYFELWPPIDQPRMNPFPKPSSRLTHSELHAMVMMEEIGSIGTFRLTGRSSLSTKLPKSHHDFQKTVFPSSVGATPSGTRPPHYPNLESSYPTSGGTRYKQTNVRPPVTRLGLPSSPSSNRQLPSSSTNGSRLSSAFELPPVGSRDPPPARVSPIRQLPQSLLPVPEVLERRYNLDASVLSRSSSMTLSNSTPKPEIGGLDRSHSLSTTRPVPRRRDSIISQRIRAYNASQEGITMETLSQFPTPPPMSEVPRVPKALDRSKYPFV